MTRISGLIELLAAQEGLLYGVSWWNCASYFSTEDLYVVCSYLFGVAYQKLHVLELHDGTDTLNVENYRTCSW